MAEMKNSEDQLAEIAEMKNREDLTEEDMAKNLKWQAVGWKG
jgi:hypothetical protein